MIFSNHLKWLIFFISFIELTKFGSSMRRGSADSVSSIRSDPGGYNFQSQSFSRRGSESSSQNHRVSVGRGNRRRFRWRLRFGKKFGKSRNGKYKF
uniref:Uncharacterized protein n=1 Tax=Strongyloides venezuelensis TaxID=75913 RepID=A0A0K0FR32_STRVS